MGRYLVDTHTLLWFQEGNPRLSENAARIIRSPDNVVLLSQISLFEISIKMKLGKLKMVPDTLPEFYENALKIGFNFLPCDNAHLYAYQRVPFHAEHRDPFDRLLVATAMTEGAAMITADRSFHLYTDIITVVW